MFRNFLPRIAVGFHKDRTYRNIIESINARNSIKIILV